MKKLSLPLLLAFGLFLRGTGQNEGLSTSLGEMLLADDALIAALQKVDAHAVADAAGQLEYHLSYMIGERAATIPDFRRVFFANQCKDAMTTLVREFDNSGLTAELLRIAPDFLGTYLYSEHEEFTTGLAEGLAPYHLTPAGLQAGLPEVVEAQVRFTAAGALPATTLLNEGLQPLLEKCMNADQSEMVKTADGYLVHPFTVGPHSTRKGYSAGNVLMTHGLTEMIAAAQRKDPAGMTRGVAAILAVWVNIPGEMNF